MYYSGLGRDPADSYDEITGPAVPRPVAPPVMPLRYPVAPTYAVAAGVIAPSAFMLQMTRQAVQPVLLKQVQNQIKDATRVVSSIEADEGTLTTRYRDAVLKLQALKKKQKDISSGRYPEAAIPVSVMPTAQVPVSSVLPGERIVPVEPVPLEELLSVPALVMTAQESLDTGVPIDPFAALEISRVQPVSVEELAPVIERQEIAYTHPIEREEIRRAAYKMAAGYGAKTAAEKLKSFMNTAIEALSSPLEDVLSKAEDISYAPKVKEFFKEASPYVEAALKVELKKEAKRKAAKDISNLIGSQSQAVQVELQRSFGTSEDVIREGKKLSNEMSNLGLAMRFLGPEGLAVRAEQEKPGSGDLIRHLSSDLVRLNTARAILQNPTASESEQYEAATFLPILRTRMLEKTNQLIDEAYRVGKMPPAPAPVWKRPVPVELEYGS